MTTLSVSSIFHKLYKDYETNKVGLSYSSLISGMISEYFITETKEDISVATNGYNIVISGIKAGSFFFIPINVPPSIYDISDSKDITFFDADLKNYGTPIARISNSTKSRFVPALLFPLYINEEEIIDGVVLNTGDFFFGGQEGTITVSLNGKIYSDVTPLSRDNNIERNFLSLSITAPFIDKPIHTTKDKGVLYTKIPQKSNKKKYKERIKSLKQEVLFLRQKAL